MLVKGATNAVFFTHHNDPVLTAAKTLQWRHNERDGVSNHQPHECLLSRVFRGRSKKTSKLRVTGLCEGNSPVTGEFPSQRASNAKNVDDVDDVIMIYRKAYDIYGWTDETIPQYGFRLVIIIYCTSKEIVFVVFLCFVFT